jgi:hypothetical protein
MQAWESALERLQREPELREALAAQASTDAKNYTWEQRARRILEGL